MFPNLVRKLDGFLEKYGATNPKQMKADLLELMQEAIEHGEAKDQNKITAIIVKGIKAFIGKE